MKCYLEHKDTGKRCVLDMGHSGPWHQCDGILWLTGACIGDVNLRTQFHQMMLKASSMPPPDTDDHPDHAETNDMIAGIRYITARYLRGDQA